MQHFIVPVDGSEESWLGVDVALGLAQRCNGRLQIVEVVLTSEDVAEAEQRLKLELQDHNTDKLDVAEPIFQLGEVLFELGDFIGGPRQVDPARPADEDRVDRHGPQRRRPGRRAVLLSGLSHDGGSDVQ